MCVLSPVMPALRWATGEKEEATIPFYIAQLGAELTDLIQSSQALCHLV